MKCEKISPQILIISNKRDFATDYVVFHLNKSGIPYLRLNRDQFSDFALGLSCNPPTLYGKAHDFEFEITHKTLRSVFFRAPVYLRDIVQSNLSPEEQLERSQWAAFIRALTVFEDAFWVNHPSATYQAEIKPYQLHIANKLGFDIPATVVSNAGVYGAKLAVNRPDVIIKSLDTAILKSGERQAFIYTNTIDANELKFSNLSRAPIIIQEALIPKVDIRVTVVRERVFSVTVKQNGRGIDVDWRTQKDGVDYEPVDLPLEIETKCRKLTKKLGLQFGAIDLAFSNDRYFFLEINPTGEWAWLVDETRLKIDEEIAAALIEARERPL